MAENNFVKKAEGERCGRAVREGDDRDGLCKAINDGESFGFARRGLTLSLKVH
jgi:hypothetical protein